MVACIWLFWLHPRQRHGAAQEDIAEYARRNPPPCSSGNDGKLALTEVPVNDEGQCVLPLYWFSVQRSKFDYMVDVCEALGGAVVSRATLDDSGARFRLPESGLYTLKDPNGVVLFGWHCIHSDGTVVTASTLASEEGVAAVLTVQATVRFKLEGPVPPIRPDEPTLRWSLADNTNTLALGDTLKADFEREVAISLPNMPLHLFCEGMEFSFDDLGRSLEIPPPNDGAVIQVSLRCLGKLLLRVNEIQPGDFVVAPLEASGWLECGILQLAPLGGSEAAGQFK
jgi:hypothetical protein